MTDAAQPQREEPAESTERKETDAESDGDLNSAEELSKGLPIRSQVAERNIYNGNVTVYGSFTGSSDEVRAPITSVDVTGEVAKITRWFVSPPRFTELVRLVTQERLVLLTGGGCGNRTAAAAALHAARHPEIIELPAGMTARGLVDGIEQVCSSRPAAGVLIDSIDVETLAGLAGFELRRLRGALAGGAALVLTTYAHHVSQTNGMPTIEGAPPDAEQVVRNIASKQGLAPEVLASALSALRLLPRPVAPGTAVALVEAARTAPHDAPYELAGAVSSRPEALDEWLSGRPTAEHVASLAAAATLDRMPSADVETQAARLTLLLQAGVEPAAEQKRFGVTERGWPSHVVGLGRHSLWTHFGRQDAEVVEIRAPHRRDRIVTYLWDCLGADFRRPYLEWIDKLAAHDTERVRAGAALTAGVLFVKEPMTAERELLQPWALDGRAAQRACAARALGAPVLLGANPAPARTLANRWARSSDLRLRRVAILAYGGPLGAWDSGSAAPAHLWRIAAETPQLRRLADSSLASLLVAGKEARQARATVIGLLSARAGLKPDPRRPYELLPLAIRRLTGRAEPARRSLLALLDDEQDSLAGLAALLARAFDAPMGRASARAALCGLLDALADDRIDRDVVNRIIRAMKVEARPDRIAALGSQIERVLIAERREGPRGTAAHTVRTTFF